MSHTNCACGQAAEIARLTAERDALAEWRRTHSVDATIRTRAEKAERELATLKQQNEIAFPNCGICGGRGYVGGPPDNYDDCPGCLNRSRAETAEARVVELEGRVSDARSAVRDLEDAACFNVETMPVPSLKEFARVARRTLKEIDALLAAPAPVPAVVHVCQIHRATGGAHDCGLSPCEEATVHTDLGPSRPATVRRAVPAVAETLERWCCHCGHVAGEAKTLTSCFAECCYCIEIQPLPAPTPVEEDTMAHEDAPCATCEGRCMAGLWSSHCSLPRGHAGDHVAHSGHDLSKMVLETQAAGEDWTCPDCRKEAV